MLCFSLNAGNRAAYSADDDRFHGLSMVARLREMPELEQCGSRVISILARREYEHSANVQELVVLYRCSLATPEEMTMPSEVDLGYYRQS
jgi:hypothetical protein